MGGFSAVGRREREREERSSKSFTPVRHLIFSFIFFPPHVRLQNYLGHCLLSADQPVNVMDRPGTAHDPKDTTFSAKHRGDGVTA